MVQRNRYVQWLYLIQGYGVSWVARLVKNLPAVQETPVWLLVRMFPWRRDRLPTPVFLGFPGGSDGKESTCSVGDMGLIPGFGNPLKEGVTTHFSFLAWWIPMDRGAWWVTVHRVTKSWTRLSNLTHTHPMIEHIYKRYWCNKGLLFEGETFLSIWG